MLALAMTAAQAAWADLGITTTKEYDGTGTCTLDTSQNNAQVCTNDEVRYKVAYQVLPAPATQSDVTIKLDIPAIAPFKFSPGSDGIAACRNTGPISADGKTLTCVLRGLAPNPAAGPIATQSGDLFFDVLTNKDAQNGSELTGLQSQITSTENPTGASSNAPGVNVVAQPQIDLKKTYAGYLGYMAKPAACNTNSTDTHGVSFLFRVALNIPQVKGHESLAPGWTYTDDLSGLGVGACVYLAQSYRGYNGVTFPSAGSTGSVPVDAGTGAYTFAQTAGNSTVVVTANDTTNPPLTSGEVVGSIDGLNSATAVHYLRVWVPSSVATVDPQTGLNSCTFSRQNSIEPLTAVGLSGVANTLDGLIDATAQPAIDNTANNKTTTNAVNICAGSYEKLFYYNSKGRSLPMAGISPTRMSNELIGPNDYVDSYVVWNNSGVNENQVSHCDHWDNRKLRLDLLDPATHGPGPNPPLGNGSNYRWKTLPTTNANNDRSAGYAHIYTSSGGLTGNAGNQIEFGLVGAPAFHTDETVLRDATCNDDASTLGSVSTPGASVVPPSGWITQSDLIANPDLVPFVNSMRMLNVNVPPGGQFQIFTHLTTLTTDPFTSTVWPDGTIIPNFGAYQSTTTANNQPGGATWQHSANGFMGNDPEAVASCSGSPNPIPPGRYCDDGYTDRLRLSTETVGVRKGIAGVDPTTGPTADFPAVPRNKGDFVTYELWPKLSARSPGVTILNDLILVDTIPAGMRFVPGSLTFGGIAVPASDFHLQDGSATFGTSTLTIRLPNQNAVANPTTEIPVVRFEAEILLTDPLNVASRQLVNEVVIQACLPGASIDAANGTVACNVQTAAQRLSERRATRTINLAASGALIVQKAIVGSASQEIGSTFTMALNYLNAGSSMVPEHRLIDILPYNGEPNRGNPDLAADATVFSGARLLTEVRTPSATGYTVYYTTAAPASIDLNPKCASNSAVGAWPAFAPGVPPSGGCSASTTAWVAATDSGGVWAGFPANTTAILVKDSNDFPASQPPRSVEMDFATPGSRNGDRYSNNVSAAHGGPGTGYTQPGNLSTGNGPGATFNTFSNNVTVRVFASSLSGTVFIDPNGNGAASGFDPGTDMGLGGVTVTLTQSGNPVFTPVTAVTATAAILAGQYYNPATGGSSSTPGAGLCPVPAAGLGVGQYLFCDLLSGSGYQVVETQPAGYSTTGNKAGNAGGTANAGTDTTSGITLASGRAATGYDFGESVLTAVSGRVYVETGGNTSDDGTGTDPGIAGVTVTLTYTPPGGGTPVTVSTTTGADGSYTFSNLPVGATNLTITETQPTGYQQAYDTPGGNGATAGGTNVITIATLAVGGSAGNNFAEVQVADMTSTTVCTPKSGPAGTEVSCTVTCTNHGPGPATNAFCSVPNASALPDAPTPVCTGSPASSLAMNSPLSCTVRFKLPATPVAITVQGGTGADNDSNGGTAPRGGNNPSEDPVSTAAVPAPVPALGPWALLLMGLLLGGFAVRQVRRRA